MSGRSIFCSRTPFLARKGASSPFGAATLAIEPGTSSHA